MRHAHIKYTEYSFFFLALSISPVSSWRYCRRCQAAVHYCDGQGISAIKPTVFQPERQHGQKKTSVWFNEKVDGANGFCLYVLRHSGFMENKCCRMISDRGTAR